MGLLGIGVDKGFLGGTGWEMIPWPILFLIRFTLTCAAFYLFFLCRMIGAGDIKLMGLIMGFLGVANGLYVLVLGFFLAACVAASRMIRQNTLWVRMERLAHFAVESGIKGRLSEYAGYREKEGLLRLGPYFFAGYCMFLLAENSAGMLLIYQLGERV